MGAGVEWEAAAEKESMECTSIFYVVFNIWSFVFGLRKGEKILFMCESFQEDPGASPTTAFKA